MAELCSLACMLRECNALHLALPQNITWNREGVQRIPMEWMALFLPGKRCKGLYNPMPSALSFRSPRDPAKSGAARCPFCSTPRCSVFMAWPASGSTSPCLSRQAAHVCEHASVCTQRSYSRGMRGTHTPGQRFTCSMWWHNLRTPQTRSTWQGTEFPESNRIKSVCKVYILRIFSFSLTAIHFYFHFIYEAVSLEIDSSVFQKVTETIYFSVSFHWHN